MNRTDPRDAAWAAARRAMPDRAPGEPLFLAPWHARAFALVVGLVRGGHFPWSAFQTRLVAELEANGAGRGDTREAIDHAWFDAWLSAAERTLAAEGLASAADVDARIDGLRETIAAVRDAQVSGRSV